MNTLLRTHVVDRELWRVVGELPVVERGDIVVVLLEVGFTYNQPMGGRINFEQIESD